MGMVWLSGTRGKVSWEDALLMQKMKCQVKNREMEELSMKKRVCFWVVLLAVVIMGFTMNVEAAEIIYRGYCGGEDDGKNLTWTLDRDGVLVIEGQGMMKDWTAEESDPESYYYQPTDWHKHNGEIYSVIIRNGIINIGSYAFYDCESLSSINLPESLTGIGDDALGNCSDLSSIKLPESLTSIGNGAFANCSNLSSIKLPESLTSIGNGTFWQCFNLNSINLPESLKSIGDGAFWWCSNLSSIKLPESLTSIGDGAFVNCSSLSNIKLPESLTSIGHEAFYDCDGLSSIVIPESVTSIGSYAFAKCSNLSSIKLPESLTSIGDGAFYDCGSLSSIVIPESVTTIEDGLFRNCPNLSSVNLPESVTSIGEWAFGYCFGLSSINLPESVTSIGEGAFKNCTNLDSIYIPVSIETIYRNTFAFTNLEVISYGGTKEQWKNINILQGYDEDTDYTLPNVHCADDDIDYEKLKEFVSRLYQNFLKREPDEKGLNDWIDALRSGKATGAKVVAGFVLSPEYKANSLSDEEYVTALYRIIFEREPDDAGLNSWLAVMKKGYTYKKVLAGFIKSDEFGNLCRDLGIVRGSYKSDEPVDQGNKIEAFVARLYKVCLGRAYDQEGLDNWVGALTSGNADVYSVVEEFFNSQEFMNRNLNDTEFVTVAYLTILGREPDKSGLEHWVNNLTWGDTRDDVLYGFLRSQEFKKLCGEYGIIW